MNENSISSVQNPTIKRVKKLLGSSKYRHAEQRAVAEGIHLAKSLVDTAQTVELVVFAESALRNSEVMELEKHFDQAEIRQFVVKDSLFESLSDVHAGVGVVVVFQPPLAVEAEPLTADAVLLEDIQDPGNFGTLLRTCAAAGINDIYLSPGCASAWSPKVLRAGMGAQFGLRIYEGVDVAALAVQAKVPVFATYLGTDSQSLYQTDLTSSAAWAFGSEGAGVSGELLAACSTRVTIPQAGESVESLNVAASVAVCLFEQRRQRLG